MLKEDILRHFTHMPRLSTERLTLRRLVPSDAADVYAYACMPEVTRYLLWQPHPTLSYTRRYLAYVTTRYRAGDFYDFAVVNNSDGHVIGTCGFTRFDPAHDCGEVGYVFNPAYHHRGLATEALREVIRFGFEVLGLFRIEARFMAGNEPSRRVMERCGMRLEGIARGLMVIKGRHEDIGICACTREDYDLFIKDNR